MTETILVKLFEHNNWANMMIIQACSALSDEQLDAEPQSATKGSIRRTLLHLVSSQHGYLRTLTLPLEARLDAPTVAFAELQESASKSGEALLALARGEQKPLKPQLQTRDGFFVEPWVLMVQVINHATEGLPKDSVINRSQIVTLDKDIAQFHRPLFETYCIVLHSPR